MSRHMQGGMCTDLDSIKVTCAHDGTFKELDLGERSFEQSFQFQVGSFAAIQYTYSKL